MSKCPITTSLSEDIPAINAGRESQSLPEILTPSCRSTLIEGTLQLESDSGEISKLRISGEVTAANPNKKDSDVEQLPDWRDYQVLRGATRNELLLMPHEYAMVQGVKRTLLSCYQADNPKQPSLSTAADENQARLTNTSPISAESVEFTKKLVHTVFGTPEERQRWKAEAIRKNEKLRSKVLAKWPDLQSEQPEPVPTEDQIIHAIAQALEPALRQLTAETSELRLQFAKESLEKDHLIRELTYQRDHLMNVIDNGPDPLNYSGTIKLLTQKIRELNEKQNLKH
jgi:hypothetical protein